MSETAEETPESPSFLSNSLNKWLVGVVGTGLLATSGLWLTRVSDASAQIETLKTSVAVHDQRIKDNDEWRRDVRSELKEMNAKLDALLREKR